MLSFSIFKMAMQIIPILLIGNKFYDSISFIKIKFNKFVKFKFKLSYFEYLF